MTECCIRCHAREEVSIPETIYSNLFIRPYAKGATCAHLEQTTYFFSSLANRMSCWAGLALFNSPWGYLTSASPSLCVRVAIDIPTTANRFLGVNLLSWRILPTGTDDPIKRNHLTLNIMIFKQKWKPCSRSFCFWKMKVSHTKEYDYLLSN